MSLTEPLDEETVEAILAGDEVEPRLRRFVALAEGVRTLGDEPLPPPSPALEAVFAAGDRRDGAGAMGHDESGAPTLQTERAARSGRSDPSRLPGSEGGRRRLRVAALRVAELSVVAKVALGASVAAAGVMVAGAGGALPDPVTTPVRRVVEAVTPIDFDDDGEGSGPPGAPNGEDPGNVGDRVSPDATGATDGRPGVDGREVSEDAPGAGNRPGEGRGPGETGLDRAGETPAEPHLPNDPGNPDHGGSDPGSSDGSGGSEDPDDDPGASGGTPGATAPGSTAPGSTAPSRTTPRGSTPAAPAPGRTTSTAAAATTAPA